jgi:hypothetical protein
VWFDRATKERQQIVEVENYDTEDTKYVQNTGSILNDTVHKEMPGSYDQGIDGLRNVRWSVEQREADEDWFLRRNAQLATDLWNSAMDLHYPASSSASSLDNSSHPIDSNRPRSRKPAITTRRAPSGPHALEDYQMQLMLLEQENKKRLLEQRDELRDLAQKVGKGGQQPPPFRSHDPRGVPIYFEGVKSDIDLALPDQKCKE